MIIWPSVTELLLSRLPSGEVTSTSGYFTPGDGGSAEYLIQTLAEFGGTPDNIGASITIANGNIAVLLDDGVLHGRQFGIIEGVDLTAEMQALLIAAEGKEASLEEGNYLLSSPLLIGSDTIFRMHSRAKITKNAVMDNMIRNNSDGTIGVYGANNDIMLIGGIWDANDTGFPINSTTIAFGHCTNVTIEYVTVLNNPGTFHGIELNACTRSTVRYCFLDGGGSDSQNGEAIQVDLANGGGAFPWFGPFDDTPCKDIIIENNLIDDWASGIGSHTAIENKKHSNIQVLNNTMFIHRFGIAVFSWSGCKIMGNRIECASPLVQDSLASVGIRIRSAEQNNGDIIIEGNTVFNFTRGVPGTNSRCLHILANSDYSDPLNEVTIVGNYFQGALSHVCGIDYVNRLIFSNNTVGLAGISSNDLFIFGCRETTINGNIFRGDVEFADGGAISRLNTVTGNTIGGELIITVTVDQSIFTGNVLGTSSGTVSSSSFRGNNIIGSTHVP